MQVFLIRHADAVAETLALGDPHRHLTPHGRAQARALGDRLRWHDCEPTHIWSSPLVRAIQTAELVASGVHSALPIESLPALAPEEPAKRVLGALAAIDPASIVLLVGHEPGISAVGALLTGDPAFRGLAKAEAARIADGALRWRFSWDADAPVIAAREGARP
ncbi:MAG TPA: histidine phosphatase family protein [Kofleriaceae bacterium]|nr:histidine phosphatase family protein [Kofleriaceae bacterium]